MSTENLKKQKCVKNFDRNLVQYFIVYHILTTFLALLPNENNDVELTDMLPIYGINRFSDTRKTKII